MGGFSFPIVFGAGVLSFLSPCVLPLVPPYLTYMSGASFDQLRDDHRSAGAIWKKSVFTSIFFILGFSLVFIALGATATAFRQSFRQALPVLTPLAGLLIIAMGLHFLGIFRIGLLDRQMRHTGPSAASGPLGGFMLGLAFAPSTRHKKEHDEFLEVKRDEDGDAAPPRSTVDLDAGVAHLVLPKPTQPDDEG